MAINREPTFADLTRLMVRGAMIALLAGLSVGAVAYFVSSNMSERYQAEATLLLSEAQIAPVGAPSGMFTAPDLAVETYAGAIQSRTVLATALASLTGVDPDAAAIEELREATTVRTDNAEISAFLHVAVRHARPERAQDLANGIAMAAVNWDVQRAEAALRSTVEGLTAQRDALRAELAESAANGVLEAQVADLSARLSSARALLASVGSRLTLFETAPMPAEPVAPHPLRTALIAAVLAVLVTYGVLMMQSSALHEPSDREVVSKERGWLNDLSR